MYYYDATSDERIKGFHYAEQPECVQLVNDTEAHFIGSYIPHKLLKTDTGWKCDCDKYALMANSNYPSAFCAHVIAVEKVLKR